MNSWYEPKNHLELQFADGPSFLEANKTPESQQRKKLYDLAGSSSSPKSFLQQAEKMIMRRDSNCAVIIDYLEMITPMADISYMEEGEKANLVRIQRWTSSPTLERDSLVIMIAKSLQVHKRLPVDLIGNNKSNLPTSEERRAFVKHKKNSVRFSSDNSQEAFADFSRKRILIELCNHA